MFKLSNYLANQTKIINAALDAHMPKPDVPPVALHKAMRYSILAGGKRLRPILCLAAAEALGAKSRAAILPAIALEALHTYSLIHDDLPAMDNDDLRRGKPTCHIAFGEATAILAGDALLTLAFEWLAQTQAPAPYHPNALNLELARAAGSRGLIAGQVEDLAAEGKPLNTERLVFIHRHKTAGLLRAAIRMGAITAGATPALLTALSLYGEKIGLAFQIVDDILNETSSAAQLGKAVKTDRQRGKMTYVAVHGLTRAQEQVAQLTNAATAALQPLEERAGPLIAMAQAMAARQR